MHTRNLMKIPFQLEPPQKLIIDTHGGIEDILGIIFAYVQIVLNGSKQQIIGITCVAGKNSLDVSVKSAQVANMLLKTNIPIYKGQKESLMLKKQYPKTYLSQSFSNLQQQLYQQVNLCLKPEQFIENKKAVDFIIDSCNEYKNKLGIVCFGPVTNLGLAHRLEDCLKHVKMISLTGGQYLGVGTTVLGNIQPNFAHDPLAAHILFEQKTGRQKLSNKIYVNVLEKTMDFNFKDTIIECLNSGKLSKPINDIFQSIIEVKNEVINCGPILTVAPFLEPKTVKNKYFVYGEIVMDGEELNGLLAIDWLKIGAKKGQYGDFFYVNEDYDYNLINQLFLNTFTKLHILQQNN